MLAHLAFFVVLLGCFSSAYACLASLFAARMQHRSLYLSSKYAATAAAALATLASGLLWWFYFQRDFSVYYVHKTSSLDLPWYFTITAFWSSLEGSHLLWTWFMSLCAALAIWTHADDNEHIMPWVVAVTQAVLAWMFYLALSHSDPFSLLLPARENGSGMNTLLQNPYMAIHPPLLFIGYTTLVVPFAYSIAALAYGDITEGWLRTVRRWNLVAWTCLTVALALGGRWAYVELGWAGYWAWDPVENSSFMPWIISTAMLHSLIVQEKLGHLKRLTIALSITAFFMTFLGTFITRSGVISSVHSFAESPIGPNYLLFLVGLFLLSVVTFGMRAHTILPPDTQKVWGVSKESALLVTQFLLLSFAAIVFLGTIFPIFTDAVSNQKISIQAPYFNAFAPYFGLAIMLTIAVGNLMHFQSDKIPKGKVIMLSSAVLAIPLTLLMMWFGEVVRTPERFAFAAQVVGLYASQWTVCCLTWDIVLRARVYKNIPAFFAKNAGFVGAYLGHLGIIICIIGFLGNYRGLHTDATLSSGESAQLYGYEFRFGESVVVEQHANAQAFVAPLTVFRDGIEVTEMRPAQRRYPTGNELTNEIAVHSSLWYDIYILLAGIEQQTGKKVNLQIHINPTVRFVWLGVLIMAIGGIWALTDRRRGQRSRDAVGGQWEWRA